MSDDTTANLEKPDAGRTEPTLSLDLSFAPDWARRPSKSGVTGTIAAENAQNAAPDRRWRGDRDADRGRDRGSGRGKRQTRKSPQADRIRPTQVETAVEQAQMPGFRLRILPSSKALASVVRQLHSAKKAYPLRRLALLLLSNPDHCFAKIELERNGSGASLFQCGACQTIAITRPMLVAHILQSHFADYFVTEENVSDPPSGLFVCVARCRRTGALIGPPNHHSYAEKLEETRRTNFPAMPQETYREGIEILHDQALIDRWKEESRRQILYRPKNDDGTAKAEPMKWSAASAFVAERVAPSLISEVRKANVPLGAALKSGDRQVEPVFRNAWAQETRIPRAMTLALRMAFLHMGLHVFRAGRWGDLATTIRPCPMDWEHAVESIRLIHKHLASQPGSKQEALLAAIQPGDPASGAASNDEATKSLRWLIAKGHIVELFNGSLIVPHFEAPAKKRTDSPSNSPDSHTVQPGTADAPPKPGQA